MQWNKGLLKQLNKLQPSGSSPVTKDNALLVLRGMVDARVATPFADTYQPTKHVRKFIKLFEDRNKVAARDTATASTQRKANIARQLAKFDAKFENIVRKDRGLQKPVTPPTTTPTT